jgi:hypothetical protein
MARKPKIDKPQNALLEALKFLSLVTKDVGSLNETHIILANKTASAFNGVLSAGISIQEELFTCPHNHMMIKALQKCGSTLSITQLNQSQLSIKSDKFKAIIPCLDPTLLQTTIPDQPIATINDSFKAGLACVGTLANENAQSVICASILMNGGSLISTDRNMVIEYWHGNDLPPGLSLPKAIVTALTKCTKKLKNFGHNQHSATFWFEDGAWIKTQLYPSEWPDVSSILNRPSNPQPLPADFWPAFDATESFSIDGTLITRDGCLYSHADLNAGASFECPGIPPGLTIKASQWALIRSWVKTVDWYADNNKCIMAYGDNVRAAIAGRK